jgi:beta-galactosidase
VLGIRSALTLARLNDKGLVTHDRQIRKDAFHWYKANWASTPTLNGTSPGTVKSSDRVFRWPNVTLRPGRNTVAVTATIGGSPYTDSVVWTLD